MAESKTVKADDSSSKKGGERTKSRKKGGSLVDASDGVSETEQPGKLPVDGRTRSRSKAKGGDMQMNLRVSLETRQQLIDAADARGISMRKAVENAIADYSAKPVR